MLNLVLSAISSNSTQHQTWARLQIQTWIFLLFLDSWVCGKLYKTDGLNITGYIKNFDLFTMSGMSVGHQYWTNKSIFKISLNWQVLLNHGIISNFYIFLQSPHNWHVLWFHWRKCPILDFILKSATSRAIFSAERWHYNTCLGGTSVLASPSMERMFISRQTAWITRFLISVAMSSSAILAC